MTPDHPITQAEVDALALRNPKKNPLLDWRLPAALTAAIAALGLVMATWLFYRDSQHKDDVAACRAEVAAQLRDADSEVIRQTAVFKEAEGGISQGLAAMVVSLARQQPIDASVIDGLDHAQQQLSDAKKPLDAAIQKQAAARAQNLAIITKCGSS